MITLIMFFWVYTPGEGWPAAGVTSAAPTDETATPRGCAASASRWLKSCCPSSATLDNNLPAEDRAALVVLLAEERRVLGIVAASVASPRR